MKQAETFQELYEQISERKVPFLLAFTVILALTYGFLFIIDFIPETPATETDQVASEVVSAVSPEESDLVTTVPAPQNVVAEPISVTSERPTVPVSSASLPTADVLPRKLIIDALDREVTILNPTSRVIADLDEALLSGVVRHPDSADFSQDGNIFILGHSSYLPTVFNKNFQALNGIQGLVWGDTIRVQTNGTEYTYRVQEVYQAKASELFVPNTPGEARLTLATCNSFGSRDDRYIVEAVLINKTAL